MVERRNGKHGGGRGSNQYKTKGTSKATNNRSYSTQPDLIQQLENAFREGPNSSVPEDSNAPQDWNSDRVWTITDILADNIEANLEVIAGNNPLMSLDISETRRVIHAYRTLRSRESDNQQETILLDLLANCQQDFFRQFAAAHPHLPPDLMMALSIDSSVVVRRGLAMNPNLCIDAAERLMEDTDDLVHTTFLTNQHIPEHLRLAAQERYDNLSIELLDFWAQSSDISIRRRAASHDHCPEATLRKMVETAGSLDVPLLCDIALNPSCPPDILRELAYYRDAPIDESGDQFNLVALSVTANPSCPYDLVEELAGHMSPQMRMMIACRPDLPLEILTPLATDADPTVRCMVACRASLRSDMFARLAVDQESEVRQCVAQNPECPPDILGILAKDVDGAVREAISQNPATPLAALQEMLGNN